MAKQHKYTDAEFTLAVQTSHSIRAVLQKLGLSPAGGNYESVQARIQAMNLDTKHFLEQAILRGKTHEYNTRPLEDVLVHAKLENTWRLKNRLLQSGLKTHTCEWCKRTMWEGCLFHLNYIIETVIEPTIRLKISNSYAQIVMP